MNDPRMRQSAFSIWMRTGLWPHGSAADEPELKFNPWHDPADGRFTFAGAGRSSGTSRDNVPKPRIATGPKVRSSRGEQPTKPGGGPKRLGHADLRSKPAASRPEERPGPVAEFAGGVGEGLYGVARGTVAAARSVLTTNPVTTVRDVGLGLAGMVDEAIAAEDTPARIQVSRAANAIGDASTRDIGRATGSVVGNTVLAVAPGAALGKVAALRRLRATMPNTTFDPPEIGWVKENLGKDSPPKRYNDAAAGARPGPAPTLMRTMPDGSKRPVKFDGVLGEYVIDRKWSVVTYPNTRAQLLRQSNVLAEHRLIGLWEVPNKSEKNAALKLFRKMNITNIEVRITKP